MLKCQNQNEDYLKYQKQKIEHALASVIDDMKQLDKNTLSSKSNGHSLLKQKKLILNNNEGEKEAEEEEEDYQEPPDFYDDDSNIMLMSSSNSTSTTSTNNTKQGFNDKINELIIKTIGKTTNFMSSKITPSSPTQSTHSNTFKGNKETLNKSIEEIKNFMQKNETTPINNRHQQLMCKSIQKIYETIPSSPLSSLRSPSLNSNRLNGQGKTNEGELLQITTNNKSLNLNSPQNTPAIASPILSNNNTLTKNSSIFRDQNNSINNKIKTNNTTSTPIRNSTNEINEEKKIVNENQRIEIVNFDKQKPPPIMRKPENAEELLRKLAELKTSPDGNLTIRLSKSRATDV